MATYDVIVIGGGTGGLVTASGCARLGRRVALIERHALGGDCLWTGCVPTKALVATARLAHQMRHADEYGLDPVDPRISPTAILESMRRVRAAIAPHDDPEKFRKLGVDVIEGSARITGRGEVAVGDRVLHAKDIVVATGSRTAVPPVEGLEEAGFVDHASFLAGETLPRSILILGGGYIGLEFAQIFARLGSTVCVVEMAEQILPKEDSEIVARLLGVLSEERIEVLTGAAVTSVRRDEGGKAVRIKRKSGEVVERRVDEVFVASGRRGNTEGLGLEDAGVRVERSWIAVDRHLQTTTPRIWACGDVHGGLQFTHVAAYEGVKLVRNMLFPGKSAVNYDNVPWTLYTDPEVAHLGLTEAEAREKHGDSVRTFTVDMEDVDRAVVDRTPAGMIKFVCDAKGAILGAHVMCANASTVIQEVVLAREKGLKISSLATRISSYPSLADAIQKAASAYYEDLAGGWLGRAGRRIAKWSQ